MIPIHHLYCLRYRRNHFSYRLFLIIPDLLGLHRVWFFRQGWHHLRSSFCLYRNVFSEFVLKKDVCFLLQPSVKLRYLVIHLDWHLFCQLFSSVLFLVCIHFYSRFDRFSSQHCSSIWTFLQKSLDEDSVFNFDLVRTRLVLYSLLLPFSVSLK